MRTLSNVFGDTTESKDTSRSFPLLRRDGLPPPMSFRSTRVTAQVRQVTHAAQLYSSRTRTSPYFPSDPSSSDFMLRNAKEGTTESSADDSQIISIVRVSSTSVVRPRVIVNKSQERISMSVSSTSNSSSSSSSSSNKSGNFESFVTPFVSLLRENRLDVDENSPKETLRVSLSPSLNYVPTYTSRSSLKPTVIDYLDGAAVAAFYRRKSKSTFNETTEQYGGLVEEASKEGDEQEYAESAQVYGEPEKVYGEPEKVYGEPERTYGEPEKVYGEPEKVYEEPEKESEKSEVSQEQPEETEFQKHEEENSEEFRIPESTFDGGNPKVYSSSFATKINDKKSSYIVDNGTYRKYRVEEKTPDGFIVGEYGMVSHQDGSLRGVRYTADSNINPSLIYEALVKFLSLKWYSVRREYAPFSVKPPLAIIRM